MALSSAGHCPLTVPLSWYADSELQRAQLQFFAHLGADSDVFRKPLKVPCIIGQATLERKVMKSLWTRRPWPLPAKLEKCLQIT